MTRVDSCSVTTAVQKRMSYAMRRYQDLVNIIDRLVNLCRCDLPTSQVGMVRDYVGGVVIDFCQSSIDSIHYVSDVFSPTI